MNQNPVYNNGWGPPMAATQPQQVVVQGWGVPAAAPQPQQVVVQAPPTNVLGNKPSMVTCPSCEARQTTRVRYEVSSKTHQTALLICLLCGWCCCFLFPYCMKSFKSTIHTCGKCGCYIGTFTK